MSEWEVPIKLAAGEFRGVVLGVRPEQLAEPTPCAGYDVRGLLNHVLYWAPRLTAAARREPPPPSDGGEVAADLVTGDWQGRLGTLTDELVAALAAPGATEGTTTMGGGELPAAMVAAMELCELVIHGWDLARATGQPFDCAPEAVAAAEEAMRGMAEQGRAMGVFGPEVPVRPEAGPLERTLALSGRDPSWRPS
ncbi:uncharacterized protein (TIGR03086 family) [Prauserella shujinwangii]|uniref:Uncharacterized protein (TIGR03086 family) n=1 Tax=Prauserella shujinwangii TaxID=1453103 RepID=A0A2T0M1M5_9PSEU|nr:TIGR03086 family metal-binding protein [Prauserella shujinwangii]PRX50506.1 uncharacterized protein (TIGR03086 family) [Prauserella shujinwangii]